MKALLSACVLTIALTVKAETSFSLIFAQTDPPRMAVSSCQSDESTVAVPLIGGIENEAGYTEADIVRIDQAAFSKEHCPNLQTLIFSGAITTINDDMLSGSTKSVTLYFQGDKPSALSANAFRGLNISIHYFPSATGWDESETTLGGATSVTYVKMEAGTVHSVGNLMYAIRGAGEGSLFKLASDGYFVANDYRGVDVTAGKDIILDLNAMKLTASVSVQGKLKVIDTSAGKCGFVNGEMSTVGSGQIEFDLNNTVSIFTPPEFNNVACMNALGANIGMKLGCDFDSNIRILYATAMEIPAGADVALDMNEHGFDSSITVYGKLRIVNNLYAIDLYCGGFDVQDGGCLEYKGIRYISNFSYYYPPFVEFSPFEETVDLLKAGAEITAELTTDISDSFEVPAGTSLTIDLNGFALTGTIDVNGSLKIIDRSYDKTGSVGAEIVVGTSGKYECSIPKTVSTISELTTALGSSAGSVLSLKIGADIAGDVVEIPTGANVTLDLNGKVLACNAMKVLGKLTVVDSAGTAGYINAGATYIGRKGSVKIAYGPFRTTFTYLSPGLVLLFK